MKKSIWDDIELQEYPRLNKNIDCDILIIGGGICGILCGYFLFKRGYKPVIVEADRIASRKTLKTTAVITALQDVYYYQLIDRFSEEKTKLYYNANIDAINEYRNLAREFDFDFENVSSYKYFIDDLDCFNNEIIALDKINCDYTIKTDIPLLSISKAIEFKNQAQMNPIKLIKELSKNLKIYEKTKVISIKDRVAYTDDFQIAAKRIIVTTGYPFLKLKSGFFLKMYQKKSYVMVIKNETDFKGNMIGSKDGNLYFRSYKNYLIIGGNDQKTGNNVLGFKPVLKYINNKEIVESWVNQDCISLDGIPYIGNYGMNDKVLVATGFNMWGMTGSMISAKLLTDIIDNKNNDYIKLFSPNRRMPILPLMKNIINAGTNMFKIKRKRCNHLGCALFFNKEDNTFECGCHGSKYDLEGNVIDGPAINNLK